MDSSTLSSPAATTTAAADSGNSKDGFAAQKDYASLVDPFLVEALQNPRHRLTVLRMELDIKNFLRNPDQQQFEFQHFPTSYLRLVAHRVAQHYGLQTSVKDNFLDGQGTKIVVRRLGDSRFPAVSLSDIPAKHSENVKQEHFKIVMRPRPGKASSNEPSELGIKRSNVRTVEERKEEYDRTRARIFNSPNGSLQLEDTLCRVSLDGKNSYSSGDGNEGSRKSVMDSEKTLNGRDVISSSRVAILRDKEKDRSDPDYDRSYERYVRNLPNGLGFSATPFNMQKFLPPYMMFDSVFPQLGHMPTEQAYLSHQSPIMSAGLNQTSRDAIYWPSQPMMYAQSYDQFRHAVFQAPFCQQPLTFDYCQNHR